MPSTNPGSIRSLNFGEPIVLGELLDQDMPGWREKPVATGERPGWVQPLIREQILPGLAAGRIPIQVLP